jgi:hypothetical protein
MDERHFHAALRYVTLNPVRARLVEQAEQWRWSIRSLILEWIRDETCSEPDWLYEKSSPIRRLAGLAWLCRADGIADAC